MLALETALFSYLSVDSAIAALVGDRIYPSRLPEHCVIPAISWHRVSASRLYTYDRFEDTNAWATPRIQVDCWDYTAEGAMTLGEAVLAALSGYGGDMAGQLIGSSFAVNEIDTYESATKFYRRILDFFISYEDDLVAGS